MTKEDMLEIVDICRVTHPSIEGGWITKCSCGYYHNSEGEVATEEQLLNELNNNEELKDNWSVYEE